MADHAASRSMNASVLPQWIARMYPGKVGRDHLGLQTVSQDKILRELSPGINVLTVHPRYYSFYTFLLDEFWRRGRPGSRSAWVEFFRPREFVFSVGAHLCQAHDQDELGAVVGSGKTAAEAARQRATYDTSFDYIDSDLGGYGLYYRSVIAELGLIYPGGPGLPYPVDVPTQRGREVADAFRAAVGGTTYYREYFDTDVCQVPIEAIREYISWACLCRLRRDDAPDRPLLVDMFLHAGQEDDAAARRATFRLLLDIASQTDGTPVGQDAFRQLLYFGAAYNGGRFTPSDAVRGAHARWRLYQAREYYAFALYALWNHLCDWGLDHHADVRALPMSQLWEHLDTALEFDQLAARLEVAVPGLGPEAPFADVLAWLQRAVGASGVAFDAACGIDTPIHEHKLYRLALDNRADPYVMVAGMVTMLALIIQRFGHPELWFRDEWEVSRRGGEGRLSVDDFLKAVRRRLQRGLFTVRDFARWVMADYVILQHQLVASTKLPENTYRFEREGERIRFYSLANTLTFTDSRFDALSTTIHELGFCGDLAGASHPLSADGLRLLADGGIE
jgi:hypothetical protein